MNTLKIFSIVLIFGVIGIFGSEIGERLSIPGAQYLVPNAEARVGRPLTPVSVAGVARRSVRRCAVGVYNCRVHGFQSTSDLLGQTNSEQVNNKGHQATSS
jgi:hypothetical protein